MHALVHTTCWSCVLPTCRAGQKVQISATVSLCSGICYNAHERKFAVGEIINSWLVSTNCYVVHSVIYDAKVLPAAMAVSWVVNCMGGVQMLMSFTCDTCQHCNMCKSNCLLTCIATRPHSTAVLCGCSVYYLVTYAWQMAIYIVFMVVFAVFGCVVGLKMFTKNSWGVQVCDMRSCAAALTTC